MENKITNKILITIRGGTLQNVFSSDKDLQIDILDYDNEEFKSDEEANIELQLRKNDLNEVY